MTLARLTVCASPASAFECALARWRQQTAHAVWRSVLDPVIRSPAFALLAALLTASPALASDGGLSCRFALTAHAVEPSQADRTGEWLSRTRPGYQYIQIEPETVRPLEGLPEPGARAGLWFHEQAQVEPRVGAYPNQDAYYVFAPGGGLETLVLVHEHEGGDRRAVLLKASPRGPTSLSLPGASGLIQTGFGRCAPTGEARRVFSAGEWN